jgi:hypothetical protein
MSGYLEFSYIVDLIWHSEDMNTLSSKKYWHENDEMILYGHL